MLYQPLHFYEHLNVSRYCVILYGVISYESPSHILPLLANITSLYLALVLVHRPCLSGHQISYPLNTSCGGKLTLSTSSNCRQEKTSCSESYRLL